MLECFPPHVLAPLPEMEAVRVGLVAKHIDGIHIRTHLPRLTFSDITLILPHLYHHLFPSATFRSIPLIPTLRHLNSLLHF